MGADIHFFVEKKNKDGVWVSCDKWKRDKEDGHIHAETEMYGGRNYNLFAILANVRNGRGFAGITTGEGFNPISMPRGLPDDVSPEVAEKSENWGRDGHSHSWLTVSELLAFDWTQTTKNCGMVNGPEFEEWERLKRWDAAPKSYCGDCSGGAIVHVNEAEMRTKIEVICKMDVSWQEKKVKMEALKNTYCRIWWEIRYSECCKDFWYDTIPKLLQLGKHDEVRIVFLFDN
jgi:hypothetical protein